MIFIDKKTTKDMDRTNELLDDLYCDDAESEKIEVDTGIDITDFDDELCRRICKKFNLSGCGGSVAKLVYKLVGKSLLPKTDEDGNFIPADKRRADTRKVFEDEDVKDLFAQLAYRLTGDTKVQAKRYEMLLEKPLSLAADHYVKTNTKDPEYQAMLEADRRDRKKNPYQPTDRRSKRGLLNDHELIRKDQRNGDYTFTDYNSDNQDVNKISNLDGVLIMSQFSPYELHELIDSIFTDPDERCITAMWCANGTMADMTEKTQLTKRQIERMRNNIRYGVLLWMQDNHMEYDFNRIHSVCNEKYSQFDEKFNTFCKKVKKKGSGDHI